MRGLQRLMLNRSHSLSPTAFVQSAKLADHGDTGIRKRRESRNHGRLSFREQRRLQHHQVIIDRDVAACLAEFAGQAAYLAERFEQPAADKPNAVMVADAIGYVELAEQSTTCTPAKVRTA